MTVEEITETLEDITSRYGLKLLYLDFTDATLISRIGFSQEVFIQIYVNVKKEKTHMALVVGGERVFGIDNEGGSYHEHPFENPAMHLKAEQTAFEDFVIRSIEILKSVNLL